jgi:hypothetical protein
VAEGARLGLTEDEPVASVSGSEVENMASTIRNKRPRAFAGQNMRISVEEIKSGELAAEQQQWKNAIDDEVLFSFSNSFCLCGVHQSIWFWCS